MIRLEVILDKGLPLGDLGENFTPNYFCEGISTATYLFVGKAD
jgi:hypothetical protein